MMRPEVEGHYPQEAEPTSLSERQADARVIVEHMATNDSLVTVAVAVVRFHSYKHPEWWGRCRDSVFAQRGVGLRLISVDNHDNAFTIGEALNLAASKAGWAEWFYHISDDDWLRGEDALLHLTGVGEGAEADVVRHRSILVDTEGNPWMQGPGPIGLMRTNLVRSEPFTRRSLLEDREWLDRVVEGDAHVVKTPRAVYAYRMHEGQASGALKDETGLYDDLRDLGAWIE